MGDPRQTNKTTMWMSLLAFVFTKTPPPRQDHERLIDSDYRGNTVLLHAAGAGKSATFDAFVQAIEDSFPQGEVGEEILLLCRLVLLLKGISREKPWQRNGCHNGLSSSQDSGFRVPLPTFVCANYDPTYICQPP